MALCSFRSCPLKRNPKGSINYYPFPSSGELYRKWLESVNRGPDWEPSRNDYVCHYHFPKVFFIGDTLQEDAVPQPNPTHSSPRYHSQIFQPPDHIKLSSDKSPLKKSKFSQICRLCGTCEDGDMKYIFDNTLDLLEKISACLPIVVSPHDELPKKLCNSCSQQLDVSFNLHQVTVATDNKLNSFIQFQKNKLQRKKELNKIRKSGISRLQLKGPIDCDICGLHFVDMNVFDEHMKEHQDNTPQPMETDNLIITCYQCGYLYKEKQDYEHHKAKRNIKCKKCNLVDESLCASRSHQCPKKYCYLCRKQFQRKKKFATHMEKIHNIKVDLSGNGEECTTCHNVHVKPDQLPNSEENDNGEDECNKMGSQCPPMKLTKTPWICKYCGKCMTTKLSLNIHERIHSGTKPYICEWCGNEFRSKSNLLQHQLTHTGVRKHVCLVCGKKFSRKSFVRSHMRVHTGERPYQCDICTHRFTQIGDMKRHRNRHHNNTPRQNNQT